MSCIKCNSHVFGTYTGKAGLCNDCLDKRINTDKRNEINSGLVYGRRWYVEAGWFENCAVRIFGARIRHNNLEVRVTAPDKMVWKSVPPVRVYETR